MQVSVHLYPTIIDSFEADLVGADFLTIQRLAWKLCIVWAMHSKTANSHIAQVTYENLKIIAVI